VHDPVFGNLEVLETPDAYCEYDKGVQGNRVGYTYGDFFPARIYRFNVNGGPVEDITPDPAKEVPGSEAQAQAAKAAEILSELAVGIRGGIASEKDGIVILTGQHLRPADQAGPGKPVGQLDGMASSRSTVTPGSCWARASIRPTSARATASTSTATSTWLPGFPRRTRPAAAGPAEPSSSGQAAGRIRSSTRR
jgi:hypothetical protein